MSTTVANGGGSQPHNNMPPYLVLNFCIALQGIFPSQNWILACSFAPTGWAFCNGQLMSISQNTVLFSLVGTYYGGDGKSTFGLPDLRDAAPMLWGQGPGLSGHDLGETGGEPTVMLLQTEVPSHPHALQASARPADLDTPGPQNALGRLTPAFIYKQPAGAAAPQPLAAGIMGAPAGGGQPHNNMMPQGIGTRLLTDVLAHAGAAGQPVQLHVERVNPARRLYDRLGFHQVADQGVYLLLEREPALEAASPGGASN